jgi:hypothetical protein
MVLNSKIFIIDDFYEDPDTIRYYALQQGLTNHGYHPGMRTISCFNHEAHDKIVKILSSCINPTGDCYAFQYNTQHDVSWIHTDIVPNEIISHPDKDYWAAVIYLTPDAPIDSGTTLFIDKKYNMSSIRQIIYDNNLSRSSSEELINELNNYGSDISKWYNTTRIGNVYNRMVIYDASYFHQSSRYFGDCKENCRLIQVFFFTTDKKNNNPNRPAIEYRKNNYTNYQQTIKDHSERKGFLASLEINND